MTHGSQRIAELVREAGWFYPISMHRLQKKFALTNVELDESGRSTMLVELLEEVETESVTDEEELKRTLEPIIEREIKKRNSTVASKPRELL